MGSPTKTASLTIEEAVARMVSLEYLPEGFTVLDMTSAFFEDAEFEHESARKGDRERQAIRANVCDARHALAQALINAIECELERGAKSALESTNGPDGVTRITTESLAQWTSDQFGITAPEWEPWHQKSIPEGLAWNDITVKIYANYRLGVFRGNGDYMKSSFQHIGLMGKLKRAPNRPGEILIGLSNRTKYPKGKVPAGKEKKALSELRRALERLTGITSDPFYRINEADGWLPRFKLVDDRLNADQRAKAHRQDEAYDDAQDYAATPDFDQEDDEAGNWINSQRTD